MSLPLLKTNCIFINHCLLPGSEICDGSCNASICSLVEVDVLELSRFPCSGFDICYTSIGLGLMIVKELELKLTLGMAGGIKTEFSPDEESWGQQFKSQSDLKQGHL